MRKPEPTVHAQEQGRRAVGGLRGVLQPKVILLDGREGQQDQKNHGEERSQETEGWQQERGGEQREREIMAEKLQHHEGQSSKACQTCSQTETSQPGSQSDWSQDDQQASWSRSQEMASQTP